MELDRDSHDADLAMSAPSSYGAVIHEKLAKLGSSSSNGTPADEAIAMATSMRSDHLKLGKRSVKYRECLKNHAASIGGHALDGCGEFMASGEDGTMEALKCAACDCHRNFHRREMEGDPHATLTMDRKKGESIPIPPSSAALIMALNSRATEMDDLQDAPGFLHSSSHLVKKRFRTKFSSDQKEKMLEFSERVGWRIQRHDEDAVQEFCNEVGVKRHVLKVWMHNNKNTFAKKPLPPSPTHLTDQ